MPAVLRACAAIEQVGVPTVAIGSAHFYELGRITAEVMGIPHVPIISYPGVPLSDTTEEFDRKVSEVVAPAVVDALLSETSDGGDAGAARVDSKVTEVVVRGSLDDIHEFFLDRQWTDGLPIIPPTRDRVEAFLRQTDRDPDEVLGVLLPARQEATVWTVAVNGVMAGCAPEYMPVLLAVVECIADPEFLLNEAGSTPGWEPMVIVSGPMAKELNFNSETAVLRIGRRANSSTGRFLRLYMRNVAGFLSPPGITDQGAIAGNFHVALAENDDFVRGQLGWPTYREDHGFGPEDTVVGVQSITSSGVPIYSGGDSAEEEIWPIARCFADTIGLWGTAGATGTAYYPLLVLCPSVAKALKQFGWTKDDIRARIWEEMWMRVDDAQRYAYGLGGDKNLDLLEIWKRDPSSMADRIRLGPEPMVRSLVSPDLIQIVIAGNPGRNQSKAFLQQNRQGRPVTKRVRQPAR